MKKGNCAAAILLTAALMAGSLSGCGKQTGTSDSKTDASNVTEGTQEKKTGTETEGKKPDQGIQGTTQANTGNSSSDSKGGIPSINGDNPVTLLVHLGEYNPSTNETPTQENPDVFNSTRILAGKFMELHPNVTIEWDTSGPTSGGDYVESMNQWMLPRVAAGTAMDIATNLGGQSLFGANDWFLKMDEYLDKTNEYAEGTPVWRSLFPNYLFHSNAIANAAEEALAVPFTVSPGSPTAYFYNKDIFEELNLEVPKTWEQFFDICKKTSDAGYIAFAPMPINKNYDLQVWDTQFSLGPVFAMNILDRLDYNGDGIQTEAERIRAVKEGYYDATRHDYAMDIWKQVKRKYTDAMQPGYASTDYDPLWREGKVAMLEDLMGRLPQELSDTNRDFEFGMFPAPAITKDTYEYLPEVEYTENGPNKPSVQASFTILEPSVNAHGDGVKEAAVAFAKFMTVPENMSTVIQEKRGAVLGATKACPVPPELEDWMSHSFPIYAETSGWVPVNGAEGRKNGNKLLEQWAIGEITDDEFAQRLNEESQKDADKLIKDLELDTTGWTIAE